MIPLTKQEHSYCMTQDIPGKQVQVKNFDFEKTNSFRTENFKSAHSVQLSRGLTDCFFNVKLRLLTEKIEKRTERSFDFISFSTRRQVDAILDF